MTRESVTRNNPPRLIPTPIPTFACGERPELAGESVGGSDDVPVGSLLPVVMRDEVTSGRVGVTDVLEDRVVVDEEVVEEESESSLVMLK